MMQIVPTYIVTYEVPVGSHVHECAYRVPETELDAFLKVLRFNGCARFNVHLDT